MFAEVFAEAQNGPIWHWQCGGQSRVLQLRPMKLDRPGTRRAPAAVVLGKGHRAITRAPPKGVMSTEHLSLAAYPEHVEAVRGR